MDPFQLDASMAELLIRRLGEHLDYNINIIDRSGIIIASRDVDRIGVFHPIAYRLISTGSPVEMIAPGVETPPGVKPGVNLPIIYRGEAIGVVGVTGDPKEVGPVAYAVKTSVETMIELELYKESVIRHQDKKNLFLNYLLYEEGTPRSVVEGLAAKLGYDSRVYRAPILLKLPEGVDSTEALSLVKGNALHTKQDISCVTPDGTLLVFKTISFSGREIISEYRKEIERYISAVVATLAFDGAHNPCQTCVGVYQADFTHYRAGYRQALWTIECNFQGCDAASPVFFLDHVQEYLVSRVPRAELCNIFGATLQLLPPASVREIFASVGALFESAFNGKEAAARLGVHRNTLTARLEHIRELFGVDVRWDAHARDFLSLLALYVQLPGVISKPK